MGVFGNANGQIEICIGNPANGLVFSNVSCFFFFPVPQTKGCFIMRILLSLSSNLFSHSDDEIVESSAAAASKQASKQQAASKRIRYIHTLVV